MPSYADRLHNFVFIFEFPVLVQSVATIVSSILRPTRHPVRVTGGHGLAAAVTGRGSLCTDGILLSINGLHRSAWTWISFMPKAGSGPGPRVWWCSGLVSRGERGFDSKIEQICRMSMMLCVMPVRIRTVLLSSSFDAAMLSDPFCDQQSRR